MGRSRKAAWPSLLASLLSFGAASWLYQRGEAVLCPAATTELVVDDESTAWNLVQTVNCTGGYFEVEWVGNVEVQTTIEIPSGTTLVISATDDGSAAIDGAGAHQLFSVTGGKLDLSSLSLTGGSSAKGGGIIYAEDSRLSLTNCTLMGSRAGDGGAVYVSGSRLEVVGTNVFEDNFANVSGGALHASSSLVSLSGQVIFSGNRAGAEGDTESVGGAASFTDCNVTVTGESILRDNSGGSGGAVGFQSSWAIFDNASESIFLANAGTLGGALMSIDSDVEIRGWASFSANSGGVGGAMYARSSGEVLIYGVVTFSNNTAEDDGGAVALTDGARVSLKRNAVANFTGNAAGGNGGAVSIWTGGSLVSAYYNSTGFDDDMAVVNFVGNTAGDSGGAIHALSCLSLILKGTDGRRHAFAQNTATNAGGGLYAIDVSAFSLSAVDLSQNSARIGGAVAIHASFGETASAVFGETFKDPADVRSCTFSDNVASEEGGGLDLGSGTSAVYKVVFTGNFAGNSGGAVFTASEIERLENCTFNGNVASSGAAITNTGIMTQVQALDFEDNFITCDSGNYVALADPAGDPSSSDYSSERYSSDCNDCVPWASCMNCSVEGENRVPSCAETPDHTSSPSPTGTVETLLLSPGYWRATDTSTSILACYVESACLGGSSFGRYCSSGYEGPYCAVCQDGYYSASGYSCSECSSSSGIASATISGAFVSICIFVVIAVLLDLVSTRNLSGDDNSTMRRYGCARVKDAIRFHALKILVVTWQIITQISSVAGISYPNVYERFLAVVSFSNLDVASILAVGCLVPSGFYVRLFVSTLGPLATLAVLVLTYIVAVSRNRGAAPARERIWRKHITVALVVAFLVYSHVSSTVFSMFACDDLDDGTSYLRADYSISCDTNRHKLLQVYAAFMIIVYPVGIPFVMGSVLVRHRRALRGKAGDREEDPKLRPFVNLWHPYRAEMYLYEMVWYLRRIVLTGVVVFIYPNTAAQIAVTMMLEFFFLVLSVFLLPYQDRFETWLSHVSHCGVFVSLYLALLLKVDVSDEGEYSQQAFSVVLVIGHSLAFVSVVAKGLLVGWHIKMGRPAVREGS